MNFSIIKNLFIFFLSVLILSCKSDAKKDKVDVKIENQTLYENFIEVDDAGIHYKIPSPMEMFIFLERTKAEFQSSKTHDINKVSHYVSRKDQAINFGVYSADLAYCAVYADFQKTINYFNTAKQLASSLGLHEGFGEAIALRIDNNLSNIDSLMEITADSYQLANQFLEDQGQVDILGLILVGGWVEGVYLALHSVHGIDLNDPIVERIADQQVLLENLMAFLKKNETQNYISEIIEDLAPVQEAFDELYFNDEETLITQSQFVNITNEINVLRNMYIN